jgi:hypothetical protein
MKKVVRLSESDLNRLVKRIISESPFDDSDLPKIDIYGDDNETMDLKINKREEGLKKHKDFENDGSIIQMSASDVGFLLKLIGNKPVFSGPFQHERLQRIKAKLASDLKPYHTKY